MRHIREFMDELINSWNKEYGSAEEVMDGLYVFATGGWSGNEELIYAIKENKLLNISVFHNHIYLQGGFYALAFTEQAYEYMREQERKLKNSLWQPKKRRNKMLDYEDLLKFYLYSDLENEEYLIVELYEY